MAQAYRRVYIDIPIETANAFKVLAAQRGMSQRALLAELVETACKGKTATRKTTRKKKGKK